MDEETLIKRQIEYYQARSLEYDEWFFRTGRYYRGEDNKRQWFAELELIRGKLEASKPSGKILEMACGTGLWTQHLARRASELVAVDASPTALELNRKRVAGDRVRYVEADLFSWRPAERFDYVFFGFWHSHIPLSRLEAFWGMVSDALTSEGKVFFVDSLPDQEAAAQDQAPIERSGRARRQLNDGREFDIVKVFHDPAELELCLRKQGWRGYIKATKRFFLYGCVSRARTRS
jgi:demethylmenaquinone methyltransferase/2-methoxy-6-polyprenyl-1,4-benzoquinol methylase